MVDVGHIDCRASIHRLEVELARVLREYHEAVRALVRQRDEARDEVERHQWLVRAIREDLGLAVGDGVSLRGFIIGMRDRLATPPAGDLEQQVEQLANFIMHEVPGEPSQSEGAVDTAIRWMRARLTPPAGVPEVTYSRVGERGSVWIAGEHKVWSVESNNVAMHDQASLLARAIGDALVKLWPARGAAEEEMKKSLDAYRELTIEQGRTVDVLCRRLRDAESLAAALLATGDAQCSAYREEIERLRKHCQDVVATVEQASFEARQKMRTDVDRRIAEAVAREREECAKECDRLVGRATDGSDVAYDAACETAHELAARIRARGGAAPQVKEADKPEAQCACGLMPVPSGFDGVRWYWQRHARDTCTLELPNTRCWCGLLRSEHVEGHAKQPAPPAEERCARCGGTGRVPGPQPKPLVPGGPVPAVYVTSRCPVCKGTGKQMAGAQTGPNTVDEPSRAVAPVVPGTSSSPPGAAPDVEEYDRALAVVRAHNPNVTWISQDVVRKVAPILAAERRAGRVEALREAEQVCRVTALCYAFEHRESAANCATRIAALAEREGDKP